MLWKSGIFALIGLLGLVPAVAQNITQEQALNAKRTISIGIVSLYLKLPNQDWHILLQEHPLISSQNPNTNHTTRSSSQASNL